MGKRHHELDGGGGDRFLDAVDLDSDKESLLSDSGSRQDAGSVPDYGSSQSQRPRPGSLPALTMGAPGPLAVPAAEPSRAAGDATTVSWMDLPRKDQLVVLTLARLSEPLVQTSLQSYMFYQLKWFNPDLPDSVISSQAGIMHASFTAAQFLTAMMWGHLADSNRFGRKTVLLIGLTGTMVSCTGFGFSTSFWQALFFRSLGGITNGNVGVLRTMISEIVREKKYQSRAFLLLPMTFNIGVIIGPILGGLLSDPAGSYPGLFGDVEFFRRFPYATPNILSAFFLFSAIVGVWLCLEETLESRLGVRDRGVELGRRLWGFFHPSSVAAYAPLPFQDTSIVVELSPVESTHGSFQSATPETPTNTKTIRRRYTQRLAFRRIFTRNVIFTFIASFTLAFHIGTFNSLWRPGTPTREVGMAMAILGVLGITLQLLVYPRLSARLGTVRSWRVFLVFFPFTYFLVPFLSLVPSSAAPPSPKEGIAVWFAIAGVLAFHVVGRTFALPAQTILVNNCTPHPSVLGTVHGIGQTVSSFARTLGPVLCGFLYGLGLSHGVIGAVWWGLSTVAIGGVMASLFVREGDGHEIWLEGDDDDE
ncbi:major facilitator superfamily domain-containing protein [Lasiosphaeris hirsuta]|uniref:Major facilitator superfamily domain-containing protein n=1 Tax=Lasiosphaeris hirsuta TaxID=260670 RepID=A0AA40DLI2_9PEZI|nr:major facilitator superfamily domain-containing protein [Lasiosphaeris hirsuta]